MKTAAEYKADGNKAFAEKNYAEAIEHFTKAIELSPNEHTFYSNRSACFASTDNYEKALEDADKCISLDPKFVKGYSRKGLALFKMGKVDEALDAVEEGLKVDPNSEQLKKDKEMMEASEAMPPMGGAGGQSMEDIMGLLNNPDVKKMMKDNPQMVQQFLQNPQMMQMFMNMMGKNKGGANPFGGAKAPEAGSTAPPGPTSSSTSSAQPKPEPKKTESKAETLKAEGNKLYKDKKFEEAIAKYDEAIKEDDKNLLVRNNKAACLIELKKFDEAMTVVEEAIARFRELDFSERSPAHLAKLFARKGRIFRLKDDLESAIKAYEDAQLEDHDDNAERELKELRKLKKDRDAQAYVDPAKADEHREKGNELFKKGEWGKALAEYEEAAKRNPNDAKIYNNRASCFIKIMNYSQAMVEVEKALKIDPKFVKAMIRKATIHSFQKEYHKALDLYRQVLVLEPQNDEAVKGLEATNQKIASAMHDGNDEERAKRAMSDPEIAAILSDPMIRIALERMQKTPNAARECMADPNLGPKIMKLIEAGIIRTA